jgi:hypothetical protein
MLWYLYAVLAVIFIYCVFIRKPDPTENVKALVKKCAMWATTAQQDTSPYLSVMHANYATGYLSALKDIATPQQIHRATGIDFKNFEGHILNLQDSVNKKVIEKSPDFAGDVNLYLASIAV